MAFVSGMKDGQMPPCRRDRAVAAVQRFGLGEYGATVRDAGHPGVNVGWAGRSYTLRLERVFVVGRPLRLARMRFEREPVGVVRPPDSLDHQHR
jgi:hypothetical protein